MGESEPTAEGVVAPVVRRGPGRPLGAKTRPKEPTERLRLREMIGRAFSAGEVEKLLRKLSPAETARLLAAVEPREKPETPGNFMLKIYGLSVPGAICPRCEWKQGDAINHEGGGE